LLVLFFGKTQALLQLIALALHTQLHLPLLLLHPLLKGRKLGLGFLALLLGQLTEYALPLSLLTLRALLLDSLCFLLLPVQHGLFRSQPRRLGFVESPRLYVCVFVYVCMYVIVCVCVYVIVCV